MERVTQIIKAWNTEAACIDDGGVAFETFITAFWKVVPPFARKEVDLSRWPDQVSEAPPDDDGAEALRELRGWGPINTPAQTP